jgi:hypothetical protein
MAVYLLTFRLNEDSDYAARYDRLVEAVRETSKGWWVESTSFILFDSDQNIDDLAATVKANLKPAVDLALVGMRDYKSARAIGAITDDDLYVLMPFTKKA